MTPSRAACSTWITKSNGTSQHLLVPRFSMFGGKKLKDLTEEDRAGQTMSNVSFLDFWAEVWTAFRVFAHLQDIRNYAASLVSATSMHGGKNRKHLNVFLCFFAGSPGDLLLINREYLEYRPGGRRARKTRSFCAELSFVDPWIEFLASWIFLSTKRQAEVAQRQQLAQAHSSGV